MSIYSPYKKFRVILRAIYGLIGFDVATFNEKRTEKIDPYRKIEKIDLYKKKVSPYEKKVYPE